MRASTPRRAPQLYKRRAREEYRAGEQVGFVIKSFTEDDGTKYHPTFDAVTGASYCDCPDRRFRPVKRKNPHCKHAVQCIRQIIRRGELPKDYLAKLGIKDCYLCGSQDRLYRLVDKNGFDVEGYVCHECTHPPEPEDCKYEMGAPDP